MNINNLKMIGQGNTAEIYAYKKDMIIKLFREGISKDVAVYEYKKALLIQTYMKNAPKAYKLISMNKRHGIIYERINGKEMLTIMIKSIVRINYYSKLLARIHRMVHKNVNDVSEEFSVKNKLAADIEAVEMITDKQKKALYQYLNDLPDGVSLCHLDYHPANIMLRGKEPIIIDWMTAGVGDPCADIARTYIILYYGEIPNGNYLVKSLNRLLQRHVAKVYYREYLKLSKLEEKDIEKWLLPVAAARLREWIPDSEKKVLLSFVKKKMMESMKASV